jgi:hypothetical protein
MAHLVKDTLFGQLSYLASGRKIFGHQEEKDGFELPPKFRRDAQRRRLSDEDTVVEQSSDHFVPVNEKESRAGNKKEKSGEEGGQDPNLVTW